MQKTNSVKKLCENLNMVSSFKQNRKYKTNKLHVNNNVELTHTNEICKAFNNYFSTVGQELFVNLTSNNSCSNQNHDFTKYCGKPIKTACIVNQLRRMSY